MYFTQAKPCADCPFLSANAPSYGTRRLMEFTQDAFPCHKTAELVEDEEGIGAFEATRTSVHCAGALIYLEKREAPSQAMRIAERLGLYDRTRLDMSAPVA